MKAGIKTSEFWLAVLAIVVPLVGTGVSGVSEASAWSIPCSMVLAGLYATQRFLAKRQEADIASRNPLPPLGGAKTGG
jgi:hypothetical protein